MDPFVPLGIGIGVAVLGTVGGLSWYFDKRRREAMHAWAEQRGWAFEADGGEVPPQFGTFRLFQAGHDQAYRNVCRGSRDGHELRIADYRYTTGRGKNSTTHHQTVCLVVSPGGAAPHVFLRRQHALFDAVGKLFGGQDLNFDDDPEFSKAWVFQTNGSEAEARRFMTPALREFLTRIADTHPQVEVEGDALLLHRGRRLKPTELDGLLTDVINLRRHWR